MEDSPKTYVDYVSKNKWMREREGIERGNKWMNEKDYIGMNQGIVINEATDGGRAVPLSSCEVRTLLLTG